MSIVEVTSAGSGLMPYDVFINQSVIGANSQLVNDSTITINGTNGYTWSIRGDFSSLFYSDWTFTDFTLSNGGQVLVDLQGMDLSYYEFLYLDTASEVQEAVFGSSDDITASDASEYWNLDAGNDTIDGGGGNDTILGGAGNDVLMIGDRLSDASFGRSSFGFTTVSSADGTDLFTSVERIQFSDATLAVRLGDSGQNNFTGDGADDTKNDLIYGLDGDDQILGRSGRDVLLGGRGDDTLNGGTGRDELHGGEQDDSLIGGSGRDKLYGDSGDDKLEGSAGRDVLFGGRGKDSLSGGQHNDRLLGQSGNDSLNGGLGNDRLLGGAGRDLIIGNRGDDILKGGAGRDTFFFRSNQGDDVITDFKIGLDVIEIAQGANDLSDLSFQTSGEDVLISFSGTSILVEDVTRTELVDDDNFLF